MPGRINRCREAREPVIGNAKLDLMRKLPVDPLRHGLARALYRDQLRAIGRSSRGPLLRQLPRARSTGHSFMRSEGKGRSNAFNPASVAGISPNRAGQSSSARMNGMRSRGSISSFGSVVMMVQLLIVSPASDLHSCQSPAHL